MMNKFTYVEFHTEYQFSSALTSGQKRMTVLKRLAMLMRFYKAERNENDPSFKLFNS